MNSAAVLDLAQVTLRDPRSAAERIIAMALPRDALWTGLGLVAVVNTFIVSLLFQISDPNVLLPGFFQSPLTLYLLLGGLMVVFVHAMYWAGLAIGGKGTLMDMLALIVWFQALRAAAQFAVIVVSLAIPAMGLLLSLIVAVWSIWIFLTFVATTMHFPSVMQSLMVLIIAGVGVVLGLGILLSLIGLGAQGAT